MYLYCKAQRLTANGNCYGETASRRFGKLMDVECIDLTKDEDVDFRVRCDAFADVDREKDAIKQAANGYGSGYMHLCPAHITYAMIPRPCFVCHCNVAVPIANPAVVPVVRPRIEFWRPFDDSPQTVEDKIAKRSRNPWGPMSYADLITKAILSSPNKRLMLNQIYDWFVANVPYFSDKGETNSSIGWKNSIRHNLSLHKRFVRLDSNGGVKSSFWTVNTEAEKEPKKKPRKSTASPSTFLDHSSSSPLNSN